MATPEEASEPDAAVPDAAVPDRIEDDGIGELLQQPVWALPWPKPLSHYDSDGPRNGLLTRFEVAGVHWSIEGTNALAPTTLRTRYCLQCLTCNALVHKATTGPMSYIRSHMRKAHAFTDEICYADE